MAIVSLSTNVLAGPVTAPGFLIASGSGLTGMACAARHRREPRRSTDPDLRAGSEAGAGAG